VRAWGPPAWKTSPVRLSVSRDVVPIEDADRSGASAAVGRGRVPNENCPREVAKYWIPPMVGLEGALLGGLDFASTEVSPAPSGPSVMTTEAHYVDAVAAFEAVMALVRADASSASGRPQKLAAQTGDGRSNAAPLKMLALESRLVSNAPGAHVRALYISRLKSHLQCDGRLRATAPAGCVTSGSETGKAAETQEVEALAVAIEDGMGSELSSLADGATQIACAGPVELVRALEAGALVARRRLLAPMEGGGSGSLVAVPHLEERFDPLDETKGGWCRSKQELVLTWVLQED